MFGCSPTNLPRPARAALLARSALHGRNPIVPSPLAFWALRIYHHFVYRNLYTALMLLLCVLAWWEPPWLPVKPRATTGGLAVLRGVDLGIQLVAVFDLFLQRAYHGPAAGKRGWLRIKGFVLLLLLSNWIATVATGAPYWLRALRPVLFLERLRNVRKVVGNALRSSPAMLNVALMLFMHLLFFSVLGTVLFGNIADDNCNRLGGDPIDAPWNRLGCTVFDSKEEDEEIGACSAFFSSLPESFNQLFILLAGATNFPGVMIPAYECNKANALFFVVFLMLGMYLFLSMLLAVSAAAFIQQTEEEVVLKYARTLGGLSVAFAELTGADAVAVAAAAQARAEWSRRGSSGTTGRSKGRLAAATPPPPPPCKLADLLAFFADMNPSLPAPIVLRLAAVVEPSSVTSQTISRDGFQFLVVNFGRLRAREMGSGAAAEGESAAAQPPPPPGGEPALALLQPHMDPPSGRCAKLLRCCGREPFGGAAPESALHADNEDAEWLDGGAVARYAKQASLRFSLGATGSNSPGAAAASAWAQAVANPLAAAAASGEGEGEGSGEKEAAPAASLDSAWPADSPPTASRSIPRAATHWWRVWWPRWS